MLISSQARKLSNDYVKKLNKTRGTKILRGDVGDSIDPV